jgi:type III secretion protein R
VTPTLFLAAPVSWAANPLTTVLTLSLLSLLPFLLMMSTSFVKFSVVFAILRSALGLQQVPPPAVTTGLALIMTAYVMAPVGTQAYQAVQPLLGESSGQDVVSPAGSQMILDAVSRAREPMRAFLFKHAHPKERTAFHQMALRMGPPAWKESLKDTDLLEAFMIGFLVFLPFLVIDMVVSNLLLAMGMHMLSPVTISMPFKLLLFVLVDGWDLLVRGLVQGYL